MKPPSKTEPGSPGSLRWQRPERPLLVLVLALLSSTSGLYLLVIAGLRLHNSNAVSLMSGADLLGEMVLRGPIVFLIAAALFLLNAVGLWKLMDWARLLCMALAAISAALVLPRAAAALAGGNPLSILVASLAVILRIAVVFYLTQPGTKQAFAQN